MNVIAVDVGTTSVRLAVISFSGKEFRKASIVASHEKTISHHQDGVRFEQSSSEIWQAICECSRICLQKSGLGRSSRDHLIHSIAFSATCSLVIQEGNELMNANKDIIMWMDHRAIEEAKSITDGGSEVLEQFGGICSPEFSLSKLIWLKKHEPKRLESAHGLFELPDWLVHRCLGSSPSHCPRSTCCVTCKWGYNAETNSHCDILTQAFESTIIQSKFGQRIMKPGTVAGYLSPGAAAELGIALESGDANNKENVGFKIVVGTSLIDAHSGMLAMLSVPLKNFDFQLTIETTFCSLAGTSSCHMLLSKERNFTRGIWGPYKDVVLDQYHLLEAGQSLSGKLIEICIASSGEGRALIEAGKSIKNIIRDLNNKIDHSSYESSLHVLPTYHGSRSPLANPRLKGGVYGITAEHGGQISLEDHYVATVESIAFELRFIVETLQIKLSAILVSGGLMKNELYMQVLADVLGCRVVKMSLEGVDFMVMGSGLVARWAAMSQIAKSQSLDQSVEYPPLTTQSIDNIDYEQLSIALFKPNEAQHSYLQKKYDCYKKFVEFSQRVDQILHN